MNHHWVWISVALAGATRSTRNKHQEIEKGERRERKEWPPASSNKQIHTIPLLVEVTI